MSIARWMGASPIILLAGVLGVAPASAGKLSVLYQPSSAVGYGPGGLYQPLAVSGGVMLATSGNNQGEYGTILLLTPPAHGKGVYSSTLIHAFSDDLSGEPAGHLVADRKGNVWGMTNSGNDAPGGTVFELVNNAGTWTFNDVVQMPASFGSDGHYNDLVMDRKGNLYGLQQNSQSVVFEVPASLLAGGSGSVETLYTFTDDGGLPVGLSRDSRGNLYGVEPYGGMSPNCGVSSGGPGCGAVWEISPPTTRHDSWTGAFIYNFCMSLNKYNECADGYYPQGAPAIGANGTLYGTSESGGALANQAPNGVFWSIAGGSFNVVYTLYSYNPDGSQGPDFGLDNPIGDALLSKSGQIVSYLHIGGYIGSYVEGGGVLGVNPASNTDTIISQGFAAPGVQSGPEGLDSNFDNSSPTMDKHGNIYGASNDYYSMNGGSGAPVIFKVAN